VKALLDHCSSLQPQPFPGLRTPSAESEREFFSPSLIASFYRKELKLINVQVCASSSAAQSTGTGKGHTPGHGAQSNDAELSHDTHHREMCRTATNFTSLLLFACLKIMKASRHMSAEDVVRRHIQL